QLGDLLLQGLQLVGQLQPRALILLVLLLYLLAQIENGAAGFVIGKGVGRGGGGQGGRQNQCTQRQNVSAHKDSRILKTKTSERPLDRSDALQCLDADVLSADIR